MTETRGSSFGTEGWGFKSLRMYSARTSVKAGVFALVTGSAFDHAKRGHNVRNNVLGNVERGHRG